MSETATEPTTAPAIPAEPTAPAEPAQPQAPATPEPAALQPSAGNADELPSWAQRELAKVRNEAATARVRAKEAADAAAADIAKFRQDAEAQRQAFGKLFGFVGDEPPTPEQLQEKLSAEQARVAAAETAARQSTVKLAVYQAAGSLGADGGALLDSVAFTSALSALDPATPDFAERVTAAISAAVEAQPKYKLAPTPPPPVPDPVRQPPVVPQSSPGQFTGSPTAPRQLTVEDARNMTPAEVQKAINEGLFVAEGFGPSRSSRR